MSDFVILALILLLLLSLVATIAFLVVYSGLFSSIVIKTGSPPIKKVTIAYKLHKGPYKESGAHFTDVCSIGPKQSCIAVYYDDPKEVRKHQIIFPVSVFWPLATYSCPFNGISWINMVHLALCGCIWDSQRGEGWAFIPMPRCRVTVGITWCTLAEGWVNWRMCALNVIYLAVALTKVVRSTRLCCLDQKNMEISQK